jgi:hypothetical protein
LWCVHALEVLLEVLSAKVRCEGDDLLYACNSVLAIQILGQY